MRQNMHTEDISYVKFSPYPTTLQPKLAQLLWFLIAWLRPTQVITRIDRWVGDYDRGGGEVE